MSTASAATSSDRNRPAPSRPRSVDFKSGEEAWMRRIQSGQAGEHDDQPARRPVGRRAVQIFRRMDRSHRQGRTAQGRSRRGRKASNATWSITSWEWSTPDKYLHDLISSDRRHPTVNANGPLFGSPEYSTDNMPILDPEDQQGVVLQDAGARCRHADSRSDPATPAPSSRWQTSAYWGSQAALGHARQQPQLHVRRQRPRVARPRACADRTTRPSARRAPKISTPRCSRSKNRSGRPRCSIPRR